MDYYRGRKIDKKFKEEMVRNSAIWSYKNAVKVFAAFPDLEHSSLCDEAEEHLFKLGFSLEEIEALELEAYNEREKELEKFDKEHPKWEQLINA